MKIGIFGGTFNPPHIGHLIVAEHVRTELPLDSVQFVPAAIPPHKINHGIVASQHRVEMLHRAIQENPHFEVSEVEIARGGVSFTVDTLHHFNGIHPSTPLYLLIGMDNLAEFHTWKSPEKILELATVVVMTRPGFTEDQVPEEMRRKVQICPVPEIDVSSREIRRRVSKGLSIRYLVSESVEEYITQFRLYNQAEPISD